MLTDFDLTVKLYSRQWVVKFTVLRSGSKSKYVRGTDSEGAPETGIRRTETKLFVEQSIQSFFPRICCDKNKKHDKREPCLFGGEVKSKQMICPCNKTFCCCNATSVKYKFSIKGT